MAESNGKTENHLQKILTGVNKVRYKRYKTLFSYKLTCFCIKHIFSINVHYKRNQSSRKEHFGLRLYNFLHFVRDNTLRRIDKLLGCIESVSYTHLIRRKQPGL